MNMQRILKSGLVLLAFAFMPIMAVAEQITLVHTITGMPLDLKLSPQEGRDTPAVKQFLATGVNPYVEVKNCLPKAEELFLTACSGCHGHHAEGKLGQGLRMTIGPIRRTRPTKVCSRRSTAALRA